MSSPLIVLLLVGLGTLGLWWRAVHYPRYPVRADPERFPSLQQDPGASQLAADLLGQLSLREKLDQLSGDLSLPAFALRYTVGLLTRHGVPSIYAGRNKRLGIPPLSFADGPRGVGVGSGRTAFPVTMARGASWDTDLEYRVGEAMGRELRATGANYSGAVCVNLLRHPGWGRAQETYGEDPWHLGSMGIALTRGIQAHHVMACVKHFALNSIECSRFYVDVDLDERTLREVYLPHFKRIVQEGQVASVMSAYNRFAGEFCGHSHELLTKILRDEWGFEGFVTSDWLHGVRDGVAGLEAGMDVEMPARLRYGRRLSRAVRTGQVPIETVDRSVTRVLATRLRYALAPDTQTYPESLLACAEHTSLAREVAEGSAVLLKNEQVLPLDVEQTPKLAVVGRLATLENTGDRGSSHVRAPYVVTPGQGLQAFVEERGGQVDFVDGRQLDEASELVRNCDAAVIVVGYTSEDEGEYFVLNPNRQERAWRPSFFGGGGDRTDLRLRPEDEALIRTLAPLNPRTVVVLVVGSAVVMTDWIESAPAVLLPFYSGMEGGHALARLLFGEVSPSGKLPFTVPEDASDLPDFDPFAPTADYRGDHGYTLFEQAGLPVTFPFGFGLSYARFTYRGLTLESSQLPPDGTLKLSVRLANSSACRGAEVTQVYVAFPQSSVNRPPRLLRSFSKVMLEPGEEKLLEFEVPVSSLAWYDTENEAWVVEKTRYRVMVGSSSRDSDLLGADFSVG